MIEDCRFSQATAGKIGFSTSPATHLACDFPKNSADVYAQINRTFGGGCNEGSFPVDRTNSKRNYRSLKCFVSISPTCY